jgi:phosphoadenosine phosphosulfate reductase
MPDPATSPSALVVERAPAADVPAARRTPVLTAAQAREAADRFAGVDQTPALLRWVLATFGQRWMLASSWQHAVIVDSLVQAGATRVPVVEFDTGLLFPETHATRERILERYPVDALSMRPARTVEEQAAALGEELWLRDPDLCCHERKVVPLRTVLARCDAWLTGMRRSQSSTRRDVQCVELDPANGVVKVNPLAWWSDADVEAYIAIHEVPSNPLLQQGYPSIGCMPCTQPADGTSRDGRWAGTGKVECGLHARPAAQG